MKSSQDNVTDKNEYESLCNTFTKFVDEKRNEFFSKHEPKKFFFSHKKLKFNLESRR